MDKIKTFIGGSTVGGLIWGIMTLFDAIDEYVFKTESFLGMVLCFAAPFCLSILYIVYYLKNKPSFRKIATWFFGFLLVSIILAIIICNAINYKRYIVGNPCHGGCFLCFNGLEYFAFAFLAIGGFVLISIVFHFIYVIVKHYSNK